MLYSPASNPQLDEDLTIAAAHKERPEVRDETKHTEGAWEYGGRERR